MKQRLVKFGFATALMMGLVGFQTLLGADDKKPASPPSTLPDYSKYKFVKEMSGEVVTADDKKITIRVKGTINANKGKGAPRPVEVHKDYDYDLIPESLVRIDTLPVKKDDKGKKVAYTQAEKDALKLPPGVKGYAATIADLAAGKTVNLILIRDKSISDDKATESDLRVKFAIIQTQPPPTATPPNQN